MEVVLPCPHINLSDETVVTMGNIKLSFSSPSPSNLPPFATPSAPALDTTPPTGDKTNLIDSEENATSMGNIASQSILVLNIKLYFLAPPTYDEVMQGAAGVFSAPMQMPMPSMPTPKN